MSIRANRYNDPALGEAFSSIASIFAPPSAQDMAGYATANAKKQEAERMAWLFANPNDPLADRKATMAGVYAPTSSYYAQNQNNATAQRGQDVTASTSIQNNILDNDTARYGVDRGYDADVRGQDVTAQTALATNANTVRGSTIASLYGGNIGQGDTRRAIPAETMATVGLPSVAAAFGAPKPLSETEVLGQERQDLRQNGMLTDDLLLEGILGEQTPVKTVGPDGRPVFSSPGEAVRTGAPAFVDPGSKAAPENGMAVLADGTQVPAIQDATSGRWKAAQTGADLPVDIRVYKTPAPAGAFEQLGVGKVVGNDIDKQLINVAVAKDTAVKLRELITTSPASQGVVGWMRGTAQNVIQTGGELGQYFGGATQEVADAIASGAADASLAGAFDPNIPAIEMMSNLLAFQYAKTTTGERLSNEMLRASRAALGLEGMTTNQADATARINQAIAQMESQEQILRKIRTEGVGAGQPAPAGAAPAAAPAIEPGTIDEGYRFKGGDPADPANWEPV